MLQQRLCNPPRNRAARLRPTALMGAYKRAPFFSGLQAQPLVAVAGCLVTCTCGGGCRMSSLTQTNLVRRALMELSCDRALSRSSPIISNAT